MDVSCAAGACVIKQCLPNYKLSEDRSYCSYKGGQLQVENAPLAAEYGLEHVPLKRGPEVEE